MTVQERAFAFVLEHPGCTRRQVQHELGVSLRTAHTALRHLRAKGLLWWAGENRRQARWNVVSGAQAPVDMRGRTEGTRASLEAMRTVRRATHWRGPKPRRIHAYAWGL